FALDVCVDNGQAVPKVLQRGSTLFRAFYSGEGEDSQETLQFRGAIYKAYKDYLSQKQVTHLSAFDFHKICTTLKDIFDWLPISSRFYTYGRYAKVGRGEAELIPWLTHSRAGSLKRGTLQGRRVL